MQATHTRIRAFRRFDKAGEPGRKTTCTACHDVKAPPVSPEDEDPNLVTVKKATKKRKLVAKARQPDTPPTALAAVTTTVAATAAAAAATVTATVTTAFAPAVAATLAAAT